MWASGRTGIFAARVAALATVVALAGADLLFVLRPLSLGFPANGLDYSWMAVLGEAATRPARWGVDLAFTYGPASALVTRWFTDAYLTADLPILVGVALASGASTLCLARIGAAGRRGSGLLMLLAGLASAAGLAAESAQDQDGFYFALGFVMLLLDLFRRPGDRLAVAAVAAVAALMGALALAKTSYGILAFGMAALADLEAVIGRRRRAPLLTLLFLLAALAAFLADGQRLGDLPAYLALQGQAAAGYGEAMSVTPRHGEVMAFLSAGIALIVVASSCGVPGRRRGWFAGLGTALAIAVALKAGFIRPDTHSQIAWSLLGLAALALAIGPVLRNSLRGAAALCAAALGVLWVVAPLFLLADTARPPRLGRLPEIYRVMGDRLAVETRAWSAFLRSPVHFADEARRIKAGAWAGIRAAQPLPRLVGGVDILPSAQSAVLANGLDYHPRPSFQDYATYTAGLIAANARFYAGPDAPDWVIVGADGFDDRYPTSIEGALWPDLLRRYEPQRRVDTWVALKRRSEPLPEVLGTPERIAATLGARVPIPVAGPVFARFTVRETLLGRLAAAVFRPPALTLRVVLAGGGERSYRFIPAIARGGFLLSPLITDADGFADLAFGRGRESGGAAVDALTVGGSPWARFFYDGAYEVELRPVAVPAVPPTADAVSLFDDLARALPWRHLVRALGHGDDLYGDRMAVPAPTAVAIPIAGARRLHVAFGIEDGAWTQGRTAGVCFAVKAAPDAAGALWGRCLDPAAVPADRGPQSAEVDVPPGLSAVTAETSCPKSCDWGWSYWSGIGPDAK